MSILTVLETHCQSVSLNTYMLFRTLPGANYVTGSFFWPHCELLKFLGIWKYKNWASIKVQLWALWKAMGVEKAIAPPSSTLAWKIPWTEEPGRLQSMGSWRVRHDWVASLSLFTFMHRRRKWQPTPVFLPGESQGWGRTESDTTEVT